MPPDAPVAAAPAPAPAAAPVAPAAAAPAAPAPAAAPAAPAAPAPAAKPEGNILGDLKPAAAAPLALDAVKAALIEKGAKAEDLEKLDEAALRAKHEEATKPAAAEVKPEDFAIKAPEGVELDPASVKAFQDTLADAKLTPAERGQKLFDLHQAAITKEVEGQTNLWLKTQADWQAAAKADPEIGGANHEAVTSTIAKALDEIGGTEGAKMREAFIFTGAGNHPEIVRLMYRMSKALVEGGAITGDTPAKLGGDADATLMSLYPTAAKAR